MAVAITAQTAAIIGVCVALIVCLIALVVLFIAFCRVSINPDTNIRRRLIATAESGGYAEQQTKQTNISMVQQPVMIPAPLPARIPVRRTEIIQEPLPVAPPPQIYSPAIIEEVVYRYEPNVPQQIPQPIYSPTLPTARPLVRSNSWSQPSQDMWIRVQQNNSACPDCGNCQGQVGNSQGQVVTGTQCQHSCIQGSSGVQYNMNPSLMPYDLAVPTGLRYTTRYQTPGVTGGMMTSMGSSRPPMNGVGEASFHVGGQQQSIYGQGAGMMTNGVSSTFQPAYKSFVKNM